METYIMTDRIKIISEYAIKSHSDTNHFYDKDLPYSYHLNMVYECALKFIYLVPKEFRDTIIISTFCHDLIEDARKTYNDLLKICGKESAEICRSCCNLTRGRDRDERMPDWIYQDIFNTPGAVFVKLCDRMANVQYSKMTGSSMFNKYKKEHAHFKEMLYSQEAGLDEMWEYLETLFNAV